MDNQITDMVTKLHEMMRLAEECQGTCRELSDGPREFQPTLIRLNILKVKLEHMRQLTHRMELLRGLMYQGSSEAVDAVEAEIASAAAEPEPPGDVDPDDLVGSTPFPNA